MLMFLRLFIIFFFFIPQLSISQECLKTIQADPLKVTSAVFSSSGRTFATSGWDMKVKQWNSSTYNCFDTLSGHTGSVLFVAYSPDEKYLASCGWDGKIILWDLATSSIYKVFAANSDRVNALSFSQDSKTFVTCSGDNTLNVYDIATEKKIKTMSGHTDEVTSVCYSPDGKLIASGSWDKSVKIWDASTGMVQKTLTGHMNAVNGIAFSPDGKTIASGSEDFSVKLWDVATGKLSKTIWNDTNAINAVCYSPDGDYLAIGGEGKKISLLEIKTETLVQTFTGHLKGVRSINFSSDASTMISASDDGVVKVWDITLIKYEDCINEKLASYAYLVQPRDEFETTEQYNERLTKFLLLKSTIKSDCIHGVVTDLNNSSSNGFAFASPKIEALSNYDADAKEYQVSIGGKYYPLVMPVDDAKTFKTSWQKASVTAILRADKTSGVTELINITIVHPVSKIEYKVGTQINPSEDADLKVFLDSFKK